MGEKGAIAAIKCKIDDPDFYLDLADHYLDINSDLTYLSLENALFFEKDPSRKEQIKEIIQGLRTEVQINVKPVSIIILSFYNLKYTIECIESIHSNCSPDSYEIIVVDNGSDEETVSWLKQQTDIKLILNHDNKGFPVGCNQGIDAAQEGNDIFLLNNDAVLLPNSLYCLRMALYSDDTIGAVGPMGCNVPNNQQEPGIVSYEDALKWANLNNVPIEDCYERKVWLVGFALLIRHDVHEIVGDLDERFSPGNFEDNDYCYRILEAGYKNILCHNCMVFHYGSKGFQLEEDKTRYTKLVNKNLRQINEKWGIDIGYRLHQRNEIVKLIEKDHPDHRDSIEVIEWSKSRVTKMFDLKNLYPNSGVYEPCDEKKDVDYIIFEHSLEREKDPYRVLRECSLMMKPGGQIIASIPNAMHYSEIIPLLRGNYDLTEEWEHEYRRFHNFTYENICRMFNECGYVVDEVYDLISGEENWREIISESDMEWFKKMTKRDETADEELFYVYHFLVRARVI